MAAELNTRNGRRRPRIDMTPFVDLGFILLSFFILTTQIQKQMAMEATLADDTTPPETPIEVPCDRVLTFIINGQDSSYWTYCGHQAGSPQPLRVASGDVRRLVSQYQRSVLALPQLQHFAQRTLLVYVKVGNGSRYQDLVNVLDDLAITRQSQYFITEPTPEELALGHLPNTR